jgi:preprotein translocase subunit Sec63
MEYSVMKVIDYMPIVIIITALLINIALGVSNNIDFSILMIRCTAVTVIFGIFGYMVTETVKNALECSRLSKQTLKKNEAASEVEEKIDADKNKSILDIEVPPLDDDEFLNMNNDSDNGFVEVNPVHMGNNKQGDQY